MKQFKVVLHLIKLNTELEWAVYDRKGILILDKGERITSQNQLDSLRKRGAYRLMSDKADTTPEFTHSTESASPFAWVHQCAEQLEAILKAISAGSCPDGQERIENLTARIQHLCEKNADAALGVVHLLHDMRYTTIHPLHKAILCDLVASALSLPDERRFPLLAAALTSNVSVIDFQEELRSQTTPLTEEQWAVMKQHTKNGVELLKQVGIDDPLWFDIVEQHHERADGSGYYGSAGENICLEAKILGLADVYAASVSPRAYRQPRLASESLKDLFLKCGELHDERLSLLFIKQLGVFPPGTFVRLVNEEIAVVIKRPAQDSMWPQVKSLFRANGQPYSNPVIRDTRQSEFRIEEMCRLTQALPVDPAELWLWKPDY